MVDQSRTALITGGSSGIGYALSRRFARDHYRILWVSKYATELAAAATSLRAEFPELALDILALDLSSKQASQEVFRWTESLGTAVDVLVNNAGFGSYGYFHEMNAAIELAMIQVNVTTVYELTYRYLQQMEARGQGQIMNISSAASYVPMPYGSVYAGTKAFVRQMTQSLAWELHARKSPIYVYAVCPGPLADTRFQQEADMEGVGIFNGSMVQTNVDEVANDAYRGLQGRRTIIRTGWRFRFNYWVEKFSPEFLARWLTLRELKKS
jgi:hypothetical protein